MSKEKIQTPNQPFTFQIFDTIDGDFCNEDVLARLIHFWEARNFKKGNMLIGIEMLLIDSESNAVQAYIPANRLFRYEERLKCNSVYRLNNFMIIPSKKVYKVSDHKQGIVFTQKTSMVLEPVGDHEIDEQNFRLRNYEDFASIVDTNIDLFVTRNWHHAMDEANQWATSFQLRQLLVLLLIYCEVEKPSRLWEHTWKSMSEDIPAKKRRAFGFSGINFKEDELHHYTLIDIELFLHQYEQSLMEFTDMPKPDLKVLKEDEEHQKLNIFFSTAEPPSFVKEDGD